MTTIAAHDPALDALWMPFTANKAFKARPRLLVGAKDMHYTADDGRRILDGTAGLWCVNAGHCRAPIVEAIRKAAATLDFAPGFQMGHPASFQLANALKAMLPDGIDHVFLSNSGSEAVDSALKIALAYHLANGQPQRTRFVGRERGYHGVGFGGISDATVADRIRADGIDILVDLVGHTKYTLLPVFARRPAPVQVSWLGYFNTTGLATMDYFVTDPVSSPPGQERYFVEKLVRLPALRFCYEPPEYMPEVGALPVRRHGYVTFGCLNNIAKLNDPVLALWARVLTAVPDSRLLLQASALSDPLFQRDFRANAARHGISAERLELRRFAPIDQAAHTYHDIDIGLDPFPFCGGMTSLDALWMGVPVVTRASDDDRRGTRRSRRRCRW